MTKFQEMINELGLNKLWEMNGPGNNNVEKVGMLLGRNGVMFHYQLYKHGGFDLYRPVTLSNKLEDTKRAAIAYIKSTGG